MSTGAPTLLYTTRERLVTDWSQIPGDEQGRGGSIGIGGVSLQFHEGTARDVGGPEGTQPVRPLTARLWLSPSSGAISQLESALKRGSRASTDSEPACSRRLCRADDREEQVSYDRRHDQVGRQVATVEADGRHLRAVLTDRRLDDLDGSGIDRMPGNLVMLLEIASHLQQRSDRIPRGGAELLGRPCPHIAGCEDSPKGGLEARVGLHEPPLVEVDSRAQELSVGGKPDEDEGRGGVPAHLGASCPVARHHLLQPLLALQLEHVGV